MELESLFWLVVLVILLVFELVTLGLTSIWFAGGALVAFVASLFGQNNIIQIVLFFVISIILLLFTRPIALKYFNTKRVKTNYESLIGKEGKVIEVIDNFNQLGTVTLNGQVWTARSDQNQIIELGKRVKILNIVGVKLIVTDKKEEL
jgi:membrane protein implicated in regulation of membrane protease activity